MPENKKAGKTAAKILCFAALILAVCAMLFSSYMGGQKKTVKDYYTAIIRDEYSSFGKYFADGVLSDGDIDGLKSEYVSFTESFGLEEDSTMHVRVDFERRSMKSFTEADYYFTVTYYDDDINSDTSELLMFSMKRIGSRWKLCSVRPENA